MMSAKLKLLKRVRAFTPTVPTDACRPGANGEPAAIHRSGLFDSTWYAEQNPDAAAYPDPVAHYIALGAAGNRPPHPLFHPTWYRATAPGAQTTELTPLGHFILHGEAAGASPTPLFDPAWYRQQDPALHAQQTGLFLHFLQLGATRGLSPHPAFDPGFYRAHRPEMAQDVNPLTHFMVLGAQENTPPNAFFDPGWYRTRYAADLPPDTNPLIDFLVTGAAQGRQPHPDIDLDAYQASHPDCPADRAGAYRYLLTHERPGDFFRPLAGSALARRHAGLLSSGLFTSRAYLELNPDLTVGEPGAFGHFIRQGLPDGRRFTNADSIAHLLARMAPELEQLQAQAQADAVRTFAQPTTPALAAWFRARNARIGIYCSTDGNFFMQDIADLLADGLAQQGIATARRTQLDDRAERFDLRIFVAPHEFFYLGQGRAWQDVAGAPTSVLFNVEQPQTQWFCRGFQVLLKAPLVLDLNFQTAALLRQAGFAAVHFMPGYMPGSAAAQPIEDVSDIELAQAYPFAYQRHNWQQHDSLDARPIDILFIGANAPRRDVALQRLLDLTDTYRFLCLYRSPTEPLTAREEKATSARINRALGQRSKIVLNIYRDWLGYFDFSRNVQYGFWQGAAVVTDPGLPHPIYQPGVHFLQESTRHLGELIRWLLETPDGRNTLDKTRHAAFTQAQGTGSMTVALAPVLAALKDLLAPC